MSVHAFSLWNAGSRPCFMRATITPTFFSDAYLACKLEGCLMKGQVTAVAPFCLSSLHETPPPPPLPPASNCPSVPDFLAYTTTECKHAKKNTHDMLCSANNGLCLHTLQHNERHSCYSDVTRCAQVQPACGTKCHLLVTPLHTLAWTAAPPAD